MCAKTFDNLPDAIRKMTSLPAQKFEIEGRGILQPGMFADIVILTPIR